MRRPRPAIPDPFNRPPPAVIDAAFALHALLPTDLEGPALELLTQWADQGRLLAAPVAWLDECLSALHQLAIGGQLTLKGAETLVEELFALEVEVHTPTLEDGLTALHWAPKVGDFRLATYLAVAHRLGAEFWTGDASRAAALRALGLDWVHTAEGHTAEGHAAEGPQAPAPPAHRALQ